MPSLRQIDRFFAEPSAAFQPKLRVLVISRFGDLLARFEVAQIQARKRKRVNIYREKRVHLLAQRACISYFGTKMSLSK